MSANIKELTFSYGSRQILSGVSFRAEKGDFVAVLGRNGAGKTTLFRCILGMMKNFSGDVELNGKDIRTLSARELASMAAYIPQNHPHTFSFSVLEMVLMGTSHGKGVFSMPGKNEICAAEKALEEMGIAELSEKPYSKLSGGEQQLVLIARALAQGGEILVMDEPTASLDFGNRSLVLHKVRSLADKGYTVLLSTHDPQQALWYADKVLAIADGRDMAYGEPKDVLNSDMLMKLYNTPVSVVSTQFGQAILPGD